MAPAGASTVRATVPLAPHTTKAPPPVGFPSFSTTQAPTSRLPSGLNARDLQNPGGASNVASRFNSLTDLAGLSSNTTTSSGLPSTLVATARRLPSAETATASYDGPPGAPGAPKPRTPRFGAGSAASFSAVNSQTFRSVVRDRLPANHSPFLSTASPRPSAGQASARSRCSAVRTDRTSRPVSASQRVNSPCLYIASPQDASRLPSGEKARAWAALPVRNRVVPSRARACSGSASAGPVFAGDCPRAVAVARSTSARGRGDAIIEVP